MLERMTEGTEGFLNCGIEVTGQEVEDESSKGNCKGFSARQRKAPSDDHRRAARHLLRDCIGNRRPAFRF